METKKVVNKTERKKDLTLFMIMVFSVLLAMTTAVESWWTRLLFQIILLSSQLLILKNLLDDYYNAI